MCGLEVGGSRETEQGLEDDGSSRGAILFKHRSSALRTKLLQRPTRRGMLHRLPGE